MKVKLTCTCGESFTITSENLINKDAIVCPNCGNKFPQSKFSDFKNSIVKLAELNDALEKGTDNEGFPTPHWKFEL